MEVVQPYFIQFYNYVRETNMGFLINPNDNRIAIPLEPYFGAYLVEGGMIYLEEDGFSHPVLAIIPSYWGGNESYDLYTGIEYCDPYTVIENLREKLSIKFSQFVSDFGYPNIRESGKRYSDDMDDYIEAAYCAIYLDLDDYTVKWRMVFPNLPEISDISVKFRLSDMICTTNLLEDRPMERKRIQLLISQQESIMEPGSFSVYSFSVSDKILLEILSTKTFNTYDDLEDIDNLREASHQLYSVIREQSNHIAIENDRKENPNSSDQP